MIYDHRAIAAEGEAIDLDPFAFWPDMKSRLIGFGGDKANDNPDYAFHTLYASCGTGPIVFTVRFTGLAAQRGTLILRVHELPEIMGAHARQIALSQTQLVDLIRGDGCVTLPAEARVGHHYALLGFIYGDTVATAEGLAIDVARRSAGHDDVGQPTSHRATAIRVGSAPRIVGEWEGSLVTPVSQPCTARQLREPVCEAVLDQMGGLRDKSSLDRWEMAFLARVMDRYDVARSGSRGLGIDAVREPIVAWLTQHGCSLLLTTSGEPPNGADPSIRYQTRQLDRSAISELRGFDFAWATRAGGVGGRDRQHLLRFIEDVLLTLKPGGLIAMVVPVDVAPRAIGDDAGPLIRLADILRIVLLLLSRGHEVAQVCPWGDAIADASDEGMVMVSAFGLIVRKAA